MFMPVNGFCSYFLWKFLSSSFLVILFSHCVFVPLSLSHIEFLRLCFVNAVGAAKRLTHEHLCPAVKCSVKRDTTTPWGFSCRLLHRVPCSISTTSCLSYNFSIGRSMVQVATNACVTRIYTDTALLTPVHKRHILNTHFRMSASRLRCWQKHGIFVRASA